MKREMFYDDYAEKLEGEYKETYKKIHLYIMTYINPGNDLSIIMNEVVDLLLSAQQDNRTIESVIGEDIQYFCNQILEGNDNSFTDKIFSFLSAYRILSLIAFFFASIDLYIDYTDKVYSPWMINVQMGGFFGVILLSFGLFSIYKAIAKRIVLKYSWYTNKVDTIISVLLLVFLIIMGFFLPEKIDMYAPIPRWLFIPAMLVIFIICTIRKRKEKQKDINDANYFSYNEVAYNASIEQLRKQYQKYCLKCEKKHIKSKEVRIWYEERYKKDMRDEKIGKIFFTGIVIMFIVGTFLTSDFMDSVIFVIILLCIEIPFYRFADKSRIAKQKLYIDIHEKDTDIFDENIMLDINV